MADPTPATAETPKDAPASGAAPVTPAVAVTPPANSDPAKPVEPVAAVTPAADPAKPAVDPNKPAEPAKAAADPNKPAEPAKPAVDLNTVPEGDYQITLEGELKDVPLNTASITAMAPIFKDLKLTSAQVNKLAAGFVKYQLGAPAAKNAADLATLRADPEFGQLHFGETQQRINDALAAFTTPAEREALAKIGMANDPALTKMFARIGAAMSESPQTDTGRPGAKIKSTASKLYGGGDAVATGK